MFYKKKKRKKKKKQAKLFNKKHLVRIFFVIFCICYEMWAAIRNMKLGKSTGPGSTWVELFEAHED